MFHPSLRSWNNVRSHKLLLFGGSGFRVFNNTTKKNEMINELLMGNEGCEKCAANFRTMRNYDQSMGITEETRFAWLFKYVIYNECWLFAVWLLFFFCNIEWVVSELLCSHRPGLHGHNFAAHRHVFLHVDRTVNGVIPHRRIIGAIDHIDLHFDRSRQRRIALVLGHCLQFVCLTLCSHVWFSCSFFLLKNHRVTYPKIPAFCLVLV